MLCIYENQMRLGLKQLPETHDEQNEKNKIGYACCLVSNINKHKS